MLKLLIKVGLVLCLFNLSNKHSMSFAKKDVSPATELQGKDDESDESINEFDEDVFDEKDLELEDEGLTQINESKNLSQLLRSNAPHYWNWAKAKIKNFSEEEKKIADFSGIVMGDAHLGNFHLVPNEQFTRLVAKNIDLDDAGIGSYIIDFAHLVTSVKVIDVEGDHFDGLISKMTKAYIMGLKGDVKPTGYINHIQKNYEKKNLREYEEKRLGSLNKKINGSSLLKEGEIQQLKLSSLGNITEDEFKDFIAKEIGVNVEILDVASVGKSRGGSAEMNRFMVLAKIDGKSRIYDIKELSSPAVVSLESSDQVIENFKKSRAFFNYSENELPVFKLNDKPYFLREKKVTLFNMRYEIKDNNDARIDRHLAIWGANLLGKWHAQNENANDYKKTISKNKKEFIKLIKNIYGEYKELLEDGLLKKKAH